MGFIKAIANSVSGVFTDQWLEYYAPYQESSTAAIYWPTLKNQNAGRGANTKLSSNVITNGSKIAVPEGTALITMENGKITGFIAEPGGYIFRSDDQNSKSFFGGDGIIDSVFKTSWERFKYAGVPSSEQQLIYVNLKEIPHNRFGTQSEIYFDDAFLNTQVGAVARGSYSIKIVDPILFVKQFVPQEYISKQLEFDFQDIDNPAVSQLFSEVVASLAAAFSNYTNDPARGNRINRIQADALGFGKSLAYVVEESYQWLANRGLQIVQAAIEQIEYDEDTRALLSDVKKADALSGTRGNSFLQQSVARGIEKAGENGAQAMAFMGMGINSATATMGAMQQTATGSNPFIQTNQAAASEDPYAKLAELKKLLDAGVITQEDFDEVKKKVLGL